MKGHACFVCRSMSSELLCLVQQCTGELHLHLQVSVGHFRSPDLPMLSSWNGGSQMDRRGSSRGTNRQRCEGGRIEAGRGWRMVDGGEGDGHGGLVIEGDETKTGRPRRIPVNVTTSVDTRAGGLESPPDAPKTPPLHLHYHHSSQPTTTVAIQQQILRSCCTLATESSESDLIKHPQHAERHRVSCHGTGCLGFVPRCGGLVATT